MTDEIDRANDLAAALVTDAVAHSRRGLEQRALEPVGACHWCNETLRQYGQLFCDDGCAEDYAAQQKREIGRAC